MKIEKDNACDRVDTCEEACKAANIRAQKAEDEVWIILKIVCDVDDMGSTIMMKKIPTRKSTSEQKAGHCEDCNW